MVASKTIKIDEDERFEESDFEKDLEFDVDTLQTAITRHGGLYWKYGKLHALAIRVASEMQGRIDTAKREHDLLESQLNEFYRGQMLASGDKVTEKAVEVQVKKDTRFQQSMDTLSSLRSDLIGCQFTENILGLAEKIFSKRTDLLTTLGYMCGAADKAEGAQVLTRAEIARRETERLCSGARQVITNNRTKKGSK